ncbi:MAG: hypothetical protein NC299_15800 [Lachnospiraceae bacterium]|nr:hypothetical protein [Ruminococcus sp.]MCM1276798.1 hypothetical protein [Lachnospiraceae bacterium]
MIKTKLFKKATVVLMAVVMMFAALGSNAFATGVLTQSFGMENAVPYYQCSYSVDGNLRLSGHGKNAGAMENNSFYVTADGTYKVTFGNSGTYGTTIRFWKKGTWSTTGTANATLSIPAHSPGMPGTLTTNVTLTQGYYDVEIICNSYGQTSNGSFTLYGVLKNPQGIR